jgi:two-component system, OmpR family, sensor histidine kinase SenX3
VASIRLYLQTLQTRPVSDATRQKFYGIMVEDSDRLLATIEQILRTGRIGSARGKPVLAPLDLGKIVEECVARARTLHQLPPESLAYTPGGSVTILADLERFHRVPGMAATRIPGTGLGLYIVRSVAKRHGGRAGAESEGPGHGSTFVLELPVTR